MIAPEGRNNLVAQIDAFGLERLRIVERPLAPLRYQDIRVGSVEMFERMIGMIEHLGIRPVIDQTFEMQDVGAALEYLRSGQHVGKVIIKV